MRRPWVALLMLAPLGCWAEVFLPADTDGSSGAAAETTQGTTAVDDASDETTADACGGNPDLLTCDGTCVDPEDDPLNCGDCGVECAPDERCESADCVFDCDCDPIYEVCEDFECLCREGTERCGDDCVATVNDPFHCGECDNECDDVCLGFECVTDCGALTQCGGACTDTELDPLHCGECGHECEADALCVFGVCRDAVPIPFQCDGCPCGEFCEGLDAGFICCESVVIEGPVCLDTPVCDD